MPNTDYHKISAIELDTEIRNRWSAEAESLTFPVHATGFHEFEQRAKELAARYIPTDFMHAIWLLHEHEIPAAIFSGLPMDRGPLNPPPDRTRPTAKESVSEAVLVGMMALIGEVYGFRQDRTGPIIHQIAPLLASASENSADGNGVFGMHVDKSVLPADSRPEWLGLYGLVNDSRVPTSLVFWDDVLRLMPPRHRDALERQEFLFPQTETLDFGGSRITSGPATVIECRQNGVWAGRFAEYSTQATTSRASEALDSLRSGVHRSEHLSVEIQPRTLLIIDNTKTLHGRGSFSGRRWLQRAYAHSGVDRMRRLCGALPTAHVLDARLLILR